MTNSFNNSKSNPSPSTSARKVTPLGILNDELQDAEPNAPISVRQARVLIAALVTLQNVVVSVMDTMDVNTQTMHESHANTNENFVNLLTVVRRLGREVGININGVNEAVTGSPYDKTTKH